LITRTTLRVEAGQVGKAAITIGSTTHMVGLVTVESEGIDPGRADLSTATTSLSPEAMGTITLKVNPPRDSATAAERYRLSAAASLRKHAT